MRMVAAREGLFAHAGHDDDADVCFVSGGELWILIFVKGARFYFDIRGAVIHIIGGHRLCSIPCKLQIPEDAESKRRIVN